MSTRIAPLTTADLPNVQRHASEEGIGHTSNVPWPYPDKGAWIWYATIVPQIAIRRAVVFCIHDDGFGGIISLNDIRFDTRSFEVDYWIARSKWGKGVCTEAVRQSLLYAKHVLSMDTAFSAALERNPASSRVLLKNRFEETSRFTNDGAFGDKFLEPMIRYRKVLREGVEPCADHKLR